MEKKKKLNNWLPKYPVVDAKEEGLDNWFKDNPYVTGMAIGAGANGVMGPRRIVHNPYSKIIPWKWDPRWEGLDKIETVRHYMDEMNYKPNFQLSLEQRILQNTPLEKGGVKGTIYETDDNAFKQSIISRIIAGDSENLGVTPEQLEEYNTKFKDKFKEPTWGKEFAEGGKKKSTDAYVSPTDDALADIRNFLYRRVNPTSNYNILKNVKDALSGDFTYSSQKHSRLSQTEGYPEGTSYTEIDNKIAPLSIIDDVWAKYLQIPEESKKKIDGPKLQYSKYSPSVGDEKGTIYYALPLAKSAKDVLVKQGSSLPQGKNEASFALESDANIVYNLGEHTIGRGRDQNGDYVSYYDKFDLNPFTDKYDGFYVPFLNNIQDVSMGIGKPVHLYDRIYLDDYYDVPKEGAHYLPEITVTGKKNENLGVTPEQLEEYNTKFKDKFTKPTWGKKFDKGGDIKEIVEKVNSSKAPFVQRLKDQNRNYIQDWADSRYIATHKLSVGTDSQGNSYIYPEVQEVDGKLIDFTRPPYAPFAGMISAEERGDTVRVPNIEQGVKFTENYKKYYPKNGLTKAKAIDAINISNTSNNPNYNLVTNNCSDATREALESISRKKLNSFLFTTPGDVREFAEKELDGITKYINGHYITTIPINQIQRLLLAKISKRKPKHQFGGFLNFLKNSMQTAAIAESPAVMTASGYKTHPNLTVTFNHQNDKGVKLLRNNLANIGEAAITAPTAVEGIEGLATIIRHPIRTGKTLVKGVREGIRGVKRLIRRPVKIEITPQNAASMTPELWTAAQDAAIARGDMADALRLRDLHFKVGAPNTVASVNGQPLQLYHGTDATFNAFDISKYGSTDGGTFGRGVYTTPIKEYAELYGKNNMPLYMKLDNPRDYRNSSIGDLIAEKNAFGDDFATGIGIDGVVGRPSWKGFKGLEEYVSHNSKNIKSSLSVTYDDNGVRIPLGERDNFKRNDIRYGLIPFAGLAGLTLKNK